MNTGPRDYYNSFDKDENTEDENDGGCTVSVGYAKFS